ncbi:hypothetical protein [Actinoplanes subglobosus]|uniref:FYVE-type domain-containing protein n=1 Tax=Actinoplanes subglobosus TaxID=1547892 RepID=A0ABV8J8S0_9ACTN
MAAIEPHLETVVIEDVLTRAAAAPRTVRRLAEYLVAHPQSLTGGPTSTVPALHRLAEHLAVAGARQIGPRHPVCVGCGQSRAPHLRTGDGWLCSSCHGRILRPCHGCGELRRAYARAPAGPLCQSCTNRQRQRVRDTTVTSTIATAIRAVYAPGLTDEVLAGIIQAVAPRPLDRRLLATQIEAVPAVLDPAPLPLSRLILTLVGTSAAGLPRLICSGCGADAGPDGHASSTGVDCGPCARACPGCTRSYRKPGERLCSRCRRDRHRHRGTCTICQHTDQILDAHGRCHHCRTRGERRCVDCGEPATPMRDIDGVGVCDQCALRRTLDRILPEQTSAPLRQLRQAILAAEPGATRAWLTRPRAATILGDLHHGRLECSHTALDTQPPGRDLEHLRALLVAAAALPADPHRLIDRLAEELTGAVSDCGEPDRRVLRSWIRWRLLARLRNAADIGAELTAPIYHARATVGQVTAFVTGLHGAGRALATCQQADLDGFFAAAPSTGSHIRPFLTWAQQRRHLPRTLHLPPSRRGSPAAPADAEHRWGIARRLVHDDTLDTSDRVAAALVVLYAQPISRIVTLTSVDVHTLDGAVTVALGPDRLELPEPFATLITRLPHRRRHGVAAHLPSPWLFPSARAGSHATPGAVSARLQRLGIQPRAMRQAALIQLAAEIPPAMLAGLLGIHPTTAVKWTKLGGGNWTTYAATRSRRPEP